MRESSGKLGVLISGTGSNLQAIIDNCKNGSLNAHVEVVISDNENAYGLKRASDCGIDAIYIPWQKGKKSEWESKAVEILNNHSVNLVCLAGYMRVAGPTLLSAFPNRILNIHPALLPSFPGLHAQKQAYDWGVKIAGCTVHFVTDSLDMGPIIVQRAVTVSENDSPDSLAEKILHEEHIAYSDAIRLVLSGRTVIDGRKVRILPDSGANSL